MTLIVRPAMLCDLAVLAQIEHKSDQLLRTCNMGAISDLPLNSPAAYESAVKSGHVWVAVKAAGSARVRQAIANPGGRASKSEDEHETEVEVEVEVEKAVPVGFVSVRLFKNHRGKDGEDMRTKRKESQNGKMDYDDDGERTSFPTLFINQLSVDPQHGRQGVGTQLMRHVELWAQEQRFHAVDLTTFVDVPFNKPFYERLGYCVLSPADLEKADVKDLRRVLEAERSDGILGRWERVGMRRMMRRKL